MKPTSDPKYSLNVPKVGHTSSASSNYFPPYLGNTHHRHRSSKSVNSMLRLSRTNTNTTDYPPTTIGSEDIRSVTDRVPTARPAVTNADKLWTKIDVLDDVRVMADDVKLKGSFFNDSFNEELAKLKEAENELLNQMAVYQARRKEEESYKALEGGNVTNTNTNTNNKSNINNTATANTISSSANTLNNIIINSPTTNRNNTNNNNINNNKKNDNEMNDDLNINENNSEDKNETSKNQEFTDTLARKQMDAFFKPQRNILHRKQDLKDLETYIDSVKDSLERVGESIKGFDETARDIW